MTPECLSAGSQSFRRKVQPCPAPVRRESLGGVVGYWNVSERGHRSTLRSSAPSVSLSPAPANSLMCRTRGSEQRVAFLKEPSSSSAPAQAAALSAVSSCTQRRALCWVVLRAHSGLRLRFCRRTESGRPVGFRRRASSGRRTYCNQGKATRCDSAVNIACQEGCCPGNFRDTVTEISIVSRRPSAAKAIVQTMSGPFYVPRRRWQFRKRCLRNSAEPMASTHLRQSRQQPSCGVKKLPATDARPRARSMSSKILPDVPDAAGPVSRSQS